MKDLFATLLFSDLGSTLNNVAMLVFRCLVAIQLFRVHGMKKFGPKDGEPEHVPNPLHLPEKLNGLVASIADLVVPVFILAGLGTRLMILPTIGVTAIGYFVVHRNDSAQVRDVPFMYTICLALIQVLGPGKFSLDYYFFQLLIL